MRRCAHCGRVTLVGGKRHGTLRFCSAKCARHAPVLALVEQVPEAEVNARARAIHAGPCPRCGGPGPLDVHTSHRVWSLLFVTTSTSHAELSCRGCAVKALFGDTVFSAALGWWSPRGIVRTPFVVARNLISMVRRIDPATPSAQVRDVARTEIAAKMREMDGLEAVYPDTRPRASPSPEPDAPYSRPRSPPALDLPIYAIVGTRPVKAVATEDGGMDVLAFDWVRGGFQREMIYLKCLVTGDDPELEISATEVDFVSRQEFDARTEALRRELGFRT